MSDTEQPIVMRLCSCCNLEKPAKEFYAGQKRPCKECIRERQKQYRKRDEVKEHTREYLSSPEFKAKQKTPEHRNAPSRRRQWAESMYKFLDIDATEY